MLVKANKKGLDEAKIERDMMRKEIKEMRKEKEDEKSMRLETRMVISGTLVPTARDEEDAFKIAADIIKEISGEEKMKNQATKQTILIR